MSTGGGPGLTHHADGKPAQTQGAVMPTTSKDFDLLFLINYLVADLKALVPALKSEGVTIVDDLDVESYGGFIFIL